MNQKITVWYDDDTLSYFDLDLQVRRGIVQSPSVEIEGSNLLINSNYAISKRGIKAVAVTYARYTRPRTRNEMEAVRSDIFLISDKVRKVTDIREMEYRGEIILELHEQARRILKNQRLYWF